MTRIPSNVVSAFFLTILFGAGLEAQTINATSCNASDVQAAFNAVVAATTTVKLPSCTAGTGWSTQVTADDPIREYWPIGHRSGQSLSTVGGGNQTVIVDNYAGGNNPLLLIMTNPTTSSTLRLAGITYVSGWISAGSGSEQIRWNRFDSGSID